MKSLPIIRLINQRVWFVFLLMVLSLTFAQAATPEKTEGEVLPGFSYLEAQSYLQEGKWAEGAIVLKKALEETPNHWLTAQQLAGVLLRLDRRAEALSLLERFAQKTKEKPSAIGKIRHYSRLFLSRDQMQNYLDGLSLMEGAKLSEAKIKFIKILDKEKDNIEVLLRLGQCYVMDGDYDSAVERLKAARLLNPYEPEIKLWLGRALLKRGELPQAYQELKNIQQELPQSELAPVWLAEVLTLLGQRQLALVVLEAETQRQPKHLFGALFFAKLKLETYSTHKTELESVKKNLVELNTKLSEVKTDKELEFESELGFSPFKKEELKEQVSGLIVQADARLDRI